MYAEAEKTLELRKKALFDAYSKVVFFGNFQPLFRQI